jgi:hypothetical protein
MKLVGLVLASTASSAAFASAQPAALNASVAVSSNLSHAILGSDPLCNMTPDGAQEWWYNTRSDGPHYCHGPLYQEWSMLRAYRSGGTANVHWKYTDDKNDRECLLNWKYYAEDGKQLIATVSGRITRERDSRTWCALPVYRSGGVQTYQWDRCRCWYDGIGGH